MYTKCDRSVQLEPLFTTLHLDTLSFVVYSYILFCKKFLMLQMSKEILARSVHSSFYICIPMGQNLRPSLCCTVAQ